MGSPVDIFGHIGEFSFIIYFIHPGRAIPSEFSNPSDSKCGIVSLSLEKAPNLFRAAQDSKSTYHEILYDFLVNDIASKKWIFHPRYKHCEETAQKSLKQKTNHMLEHFHSNEDKSRLVRHGNKKRNRRSRSTPILEEAIDIPIIEIPRRRAEFECVICHSVWEDWEPSDSVCPQCNTHLYPTVKGYLDSE